MLTRFPDRSLEQITFGEFRQAFGGGLAAQLSVLARLEALYWMPPQRPASARVAAESIAPATSPGELHALVQRVLALPWLAKVSRDDIRFRYPGPGTLDEWLRHQFAGAALPADAVDLLRKLGAAAGMTAADEARELLLAACDECLPHDIDGASRWSTMLMARHLSSQGTGKTLSEIGEEHGITRERVRQICAEGEEVLQERDILTPALDRVLAAVERIAPCAVAEADEQFARFIGQGAGVECLIAWARRLADRARGSSATVCVAPCEARWWRWPSWSAPTPRPG